jgi:hypothetical protein
MRRQAARPGFGAAVFAGGLVALGAAVGWSAPARSAVAPVTLESLLREMVDREALARYPEREYRTLQASSYDRASVAPDQPGWFANDDRGKYLRTETRDGRTEYVLMDVEGPGAVVRIWSANPEVAGTMRVYLDGASEPALAGPGADLLGGGGPIAGPLGGLRARGYSLYVPIPYARRAKITVDSNARPGLYYQVNYRTYPAGTPVETFSLAALAAAGPAVARVQQLLAAPPTVAAARTVALRQRAIAPGASTTVTLPGGANAVRSLTMRLTGGDPERTLRTTVIEMAFDGQPTVWAPVGDFFGSGLGHNAYEDWWRTVGGDGTMTARWVMPYQRAGTITLRNLGDKPVTASLAAGVDAWRWDERSMYFHATFRREADIPSRPARDWNYVTVRGRGLYVGDALAIHNDVARWWGEGDEKIYVDGERFPSHFGTGTEDYYGYAWCSTQLFSGPFHAQPRNDQRAQTVRMCRHHLGHAAVTRTRALDAIPFADSLRVDMEILHQADTARVDYAATAYWYARPGSRSNRGAAPEAARPPAGAGAARPDTRR